MIPQSRKGTLHRLPSRHYFCTNVGTLQQLPGHDDIMPHSEEVWTGNRDQVGEGRHHKANGRCICTNAPHRRRFNPYCYGDFELILRAPGCTCNTTCGHRTSLSHQRPSTVQLKTPISKTCTTPVMCAGCKCTQGVCEEWRRSPVHMCK